MANADGNIAIRVQLLEARTAALEMGMVTDSMAAAKAQAVETGVAMGVTGDEISLTGDKSVAAGAKMTALGSGMSSLGRKLTMISVPLLAVAGYAVYTAIKYQQAMTLIQTQAGATAKEVSSMYNKVGNAAATFGFSPTAGAQAMYWIESGGLRGAKALDVLKASMIGAKVGGSDLGETANLLTGILNQNMRGVHGASDAMGQLIAIVGHGKMTLAELMTSLGTGLPDTAVLAGLNLRDVGAAMDVMTTKTLPANRAATGLRFLLKSMDAPTAAAQKMLAGINMSSTELATDLTKPNGLVVAFKDLKTHLTAAGVSGQAIPLSLTRRSAGREEWWPPPASTTT